MNVRRRCLLIVVALVAIAGLAGFSDGAAETVCRAASPSVLSAAVCDVSFGTDAALHRAAAPSPRSGGRVRAAQGAEWRGGTLLKTNDLRPDTPSRRCSASERSARSLRAHDDVRAACGDSRPENLQRAASGDSRPGGLLRAASGCGAALSGEGFLAELLIERECNLLSLPAGEAAVGERPVRSLSWGGPRTMFRAVPADGEIGAGRIPARILHVTKGRPQRSVAGECLRVLRRWRI